SHYRSGRKYRISRDENSEEYSHVISIKEPPWPDLSNADGDDCCPVHVCHLGRGSEPACPQVGALRRIFLLPAGCGYPWPTSRRTPPTEQPLGSQSARRRRQHYLQF